MPTLIDRLDHEVFAQAYAASGNRLEAGAAVGLTQPHLIAALLRKANVAKRVEELVGERFARFNLTADRTMQELGRIAFADARELFDEFGELKPTLQWNDDVAAAVSRVDVEINGVGRGASRTVVVTKKVRMADKMAALSLLAKHFKIVGDDDDGVNALANALAGRLKAARNRSAEVFENAPDAAVHAVERGAAMPGARLEYTVEDDPSNADDTSSTWTVVKHDPEAMHSMHPVPELAAAVPLRSAASHDPPMVQPPKLDTLKDAPKVRQGPRAPGASVIARNVAVAAKMGITPVTTLADGTKNATGMPLFGRPMPGRTLPGNPTADALAAAAAGAFTLPDDSDDYPLD